MLRVNSFKKFHNKSEEWNWVVARKSRVERKLTTGYFEDKRLRQVFNGLVEVVSKMEEVTDTGRVMDRSTFWEKWL